MSKQLRLSLADHTRHGFVPSLSSSNFITDSLVLSFDAAAAAFGPVVIATVDEVNFR